MKRLSATDILAGSQTLCLKVGSSLLGQGKGTSISRTWVGQLAEDIAVLHRKGKQIVVVSSGAVAAAALSLQQGDTLVRKQALSAVGQPRLMMVYAEAFAKAGIVTAQILMNPADTEDRRRHLNVRGTIEELLQAGVVPVINENDSVSSAALRYGDNDRLAARVASMVNADCLVMFSDVDGLYDCPPRQNPKARHLPWLEAITADVKAMAGQKGSTVGTGGMETKLIAAEICLASNCHMLLGSGLGTHPLAALIDGGKCTVFQASGSPIQARKRWLAATLSPTGTVRVDAGAARALEAGKSLLAAGVTNTEGQFQRGDPVRVMSLDDIVLGHGLINYDHNEVEQIVGAKSAEIAERLGYVREGTLIHRDNLILTTVSRG